MTERTHTTNATTQCPSTDPRPFDRPHKRLQPLIRLQHVVQLLNGLQVLLQHHRAARQLLRHMAHLRKVIGVRGVQLLLLVHDGQHLSGLRFDVTDASVDGGLIGGDASGAQMQMCLHALTDVGQVAGMQPFEHLGITVGGQRVVPAAHHRQKLRYVLGVKIWYGKLL